MPLDHQMRPGDVLEVGQAAILLVGLKRGSATVRIHAPAGAHVRYRRRDRTPRPPASSEVDLTEDPEST